MTGSFAAGRMATPFGMRRQPQPELSEDLARQMSGVAANDDAVVVGRVLLDFVQGRGRAAAALDHVRVPRSGAVVGGGERLSDDRRLVHGAAGEVGQLVRNLHPGRVATLMAGVGAGDGEAVGQADGHRVVIDDPAETVGARAAEVAVPPRDRHPHFHADVRGGRWPQGRRHAAEGWQRAERRDASAAVVPEAQSGRVGRHSSGHVRDRTDRPCQRGRAASFSRRVAGHRRTRPRSPPARA